MTYTIAVAGKGGTGKTTLASLMIAELINSGRKPVLAIDADPNANLNENLGVEIPETLGNILAGSLDRQKIPASADKRRHIEFQVQTALAEEKWFDLMVMGRTEGPGCYCSVNDILRSYMDKLVPNYEYSVLDNEAGMEHISRRTTRDIDDLLIVSDHNPVGIRSATRIHELVRSLEINIGKSYLVVNRIEGEIDPRIKEEIEDSGLELIGSIPDDEQLMEFNLERRSLLELPEDSAARKSARAILEQLMA